MIIKDNQRKKEEERRMQLQYNKGLSIAIKERNRANIQSMNLKSKQFIVNREKRAYEKRLNEQVKDIEMKREKSYQIKSHQKQFLVYKALQQQVKREEVARLYAKKESYCG